MKFVLQHLDTGHYVHSQLGGVVVSYTPALEGAKRWTAQDTAVIEMAEAQNLQMVPVHEDRAVGHIRFRSPE